MRSVHVRNFNFEFEKQNIKREKVSYLFNTIALYGNDSYD